MSLSGVATITAMTFLAELGDLTRFDSPRQLVSFFMNTPRVRAGAAGRSTRPLGLRPGNPKPPVPTKSAGEIPEKVELVSCIISHCSVDHGVVSFPG